MVGGYRYKINTEEYLVNPLSYVLRENEWFSNEEERVEQDVEVYVTNHPENVFDCSA